MASFTSGAGTVKTPFGKNVYLRNTGGCKFESYSLAAATVPAKTIDGVAGQKVLQPGTVMAKITAAGADQGKIGPFSAAATDGRQTALNIVGILDTFLPWQAMERDVEVGVLTEGTVVQAWCFEYDGSNNAIALSNATADALVGAAGTEPVFRSKRLDIKFA